MFTTNYNSHSPTVKSITGITLIITKAYQVTKYNQILYLKPFKTQLVQVLFSYKYQIDTLCFCTNKLP